MKLVQAQIQTQAQMPELLSNLVLELADLFLDYNLSRQSEIIQAMELLKRYESFPMNAGEIFLNGFRVAIEEDAEQRGYSLEG